MIRIEASTELAQYAPGIEELLWACYPKPPQNVYAMLGANYQGQEPFLMALDAETVVGFVVAIRFSKGTVLEHLAVHPEYQGAGIGRRLVAAYLEVYGRGLCLLTTRIVPFFQKFGFQSVYPLPDGATLMVRSPTLPA